MSRRTRTLTLTLVGPSLLAAGCAADPPAPRARHVPAPVAAADEFGPQQERVLAAALGANAVGNAGLQPLSALPVVVYAFSTSEPPPRPGTTRRYPSSSHRHSPVFIAPYHWTTSRYHAPGVYHPARPAPRTSRPVTSTRPSSSRPVTSSRPSSSRPTSRVGGFGRTGRSVGS